MAEIIDVSAWEQVAEEPSGEDPKMWVTPLLVPDSPSRTNFWLFKSAKHGSELQADSAEATPYRRADDHSEWLAARLAALIELPAAEVHYAVSSTDSGVISRNVAPDGWEMEAGDLLLLDYDGYVSCETKPKNRTGHNLINIANLMRGVSSPPDSATEGETAFEVFAGYLVLDAWIANTDRHAMNWSLMRRGKEQALAPSFDHGSAFGSGNNEQRVEQLVEQGVQRFCERGYARSFEDGRRQPLTDLAMDATRLAGPQAVSWIERLGDLDASSWSHFIDDMDGVSEHRSRFMSAVLDQNRRRLLDARRHP